MLKMKRMMISICQLFHWTNNFHLFEGKKKIDEWNIIWIELNENGYDGSI